MAETQATTTEAADVATGLTAPTDGQTEASATADAGNATEQSQEQPKLGWRKQLKQEHWENEKARQFESPTELFEKYLELEDRAGRAIVKPGEDASEEEVAAYYESLGVPSSKEAYNLETPEGIDETAADIFAERALKAKLTPSQAKQLFEMNVEAYQEAVRAKEKRTEKSREALKKEWGNDYDSKLQSAQKLVEEFGGEEALKTLRTSELGESPELVQMFAKLAAAFAEDSATAGGRPNGARGVERLMDGVPMLNIRGPG